MSFHRTSHAIDSVSYTAWTMTDVMGGWNERPGSMICPTIGKRATGADSKLAAPFARSIGSCT